MQIINYTDNRSRYCFLGKKIMRNYSEMDFAVHYALRFGEVAIRKGFITRQQLREALEEQLSNKSYLRLRPRKLIGEILREHGLMTSAQIEMVLKEMKRIKRP